MLAANYAAVRHAERRDGWWQVDVEDLQSHRQLRVTSRYLVNAGGVWAEEIGDLAGHADARIRPSKGVHISLAAETLPIKSALAFPVGDGRVLFAIPWLGYVVVGTTDGDFQGDVAHPDCTEDEAEDLVRGVNRFFDLQLGPDAVLSRWAGVRPLVSNGGGATHTKDLSRQPFISMGTDGLLTVTGGKLTTFWRMALDAVNLLPGAPGPEAAEPWVPIERASADPQGQPLPGAAGYTTADVARACEQEMALNLDDALSRRLRLGFLDSAAAAAAAQPAAAVMAGRLGWESSEDQLARFAEHLRRDFGHRPTTAAMPSGQAAG